MRLPRCLGDTLFRRLFILMWVALVGSHVVAYAVVSLMRVEAPGMSMSKGGGPGLPTFPSLPPTPGLDGHAGPGWRGGPDMGKPDHPEGRNQPAVQGSMAVPGSQGERNDDAGGNPPPHAPGSMNNGPDVPAGLTGMLALDYGIRLLIIGLAAWLGARWLSRPMHTLASASRALTVTLGRDAAKFEKLDESRGTAEVRDTARVFNDMAKRLSEQFKARGLMVAALSHDLRTPLTRLRMRLACLPEDTQVERCVGDIREMNELIDTALQMFRDADASEPAQNTDVYSVVQSLADDWIEQQQPVVFQGEAAVVQAQPVLLRRVVSNLIANAVRYGQRAEVSVRAHPRHVAIVVEDHGPGIPEDQLEAVFQPFYRVEGSRNRDTGGTGLGLYIARDLIARQGGTLTLANRAEGGLRAEVRLPRDKVGR